MKVRVTLMTENDKHVDKHYADSYVDEQARKGWDIVCKLLENISGEKIAVESVDVLER